MKTALIYTSPARGHLYPVMDVAIRLKQEGYRVAVQTLSGEKKRVEDEGMEHISISPEIERIPLEDYKEKNPVSQIKATFRCWLNRAPCEVNDLEQSTDQYDPDLLIVDANTWGAQAFAESVKKTWVMFMPYCLPVASSDTPAFGPGFAPPENLFHRLRDRFVNGLVRNAVSGLIDEYNELRSGLGASELNQYQDIFDRPDLVLYRTSEPFDYPRSKMPDKILPIGPGLWSPPAEVPEWVDTLPAPRVLVTVSTEMQNDRAIIETAIRTLPEMGLSLIATTAALDPKSFQVPNEQIRLVRFLPHAEIIRHMDLVITHGGMGTVQRALASGVPVCVIPWGRDQNETARRVEISGAGSMLPKKKLNQKYLRGAVETAINRKRGAEKIADVFAEAGGAELAMKAIRRLHAH